MKNTEFKAIAMRCTEEQFKAIEPKLVDININSISDFGLYPFLTNISGKDVKAINNVSNRESFDFIWDNVRYYDVWDEDLFMKCCGISTELKVGVWYTRKTFGRFMFRFSGGYGNGATYGFDYDGVFSERVGVHKVNPYEQATRQEIRQALIEEAKRRGVWDVPMVSLNGDIKREPSFASVYDIENDVLWSTYGRIYENGEWATALGKAMTKSEIEQELGYKIEIL
jgi:hypothetical protein